jgi:hypothetical protein
MVLLTALQSALQTCQRQTTQVLPAAGESQFTCLLCVRLSLALFPPSSIANVSVSGGRGGGATVVIGSESFVSHSVVSVNGFEATNNSAGALVLVTLAGWLMFQVR